MSLIWFPLIYHWAVLPACFDLCAIPFLLTVSNQAGDRCEVEPGEKRGVVKYVGQAEALGPGFWIGVQYDEPLGKHDGMYVNSIFLLFFSFFVWFSHYFLVI